MNLHDSVETRIERDETTVRCACGRVFRAPTRSQATRSHAAHFHLEQIRAAIEPKAAE